MESYGGSSRIFRAFYVVLLVQTRSESLKKTFSKVAKVESNLVVVGHLREFFFLLGSYFTFSKHLIKPAEMIEKDERILHIDGREDVHTGQLQNFANFFLGGHEAKQVLLHVRQQQPPKIVGIIGDPQRQQCLVSTHGRDSTKSLQ